LSARDEPIATADEAGAARTARTDGRRGGGGRPRRAFLGRTESRTSLFSLVQAGADVAGAVQRCDRARSRRDETRSRMCRARAGEAVQSCRPHVRAAPAAADCESIVC
jgi:hypothetical protein